METTQYHDIKSESLPTRPEPTAQPVRSPRSSWQRQHQESDKEEGPHTQMTQQRQHHHPSVSSGARSLHTVDSIDIEKQVLRTGTRDNDGQSSNRSSLRRPKEHISHLEASPQRVGRGSDSSPHHQTIRQHIDDDDDDDDLAERADPTLAPKAVKLLLFFLLPLPFLSFALAIWTILITILLTLLHPIRLIFTRKRSYTEIVLSLLAPTLNLHLRCIHSFPVAGAELQLAQTLSVLVLGSAFSLALAVWAAVLSVYWVFAAVIGNPDGLDGRSDGRELVLATRGKWDDWLRLSVRPELRS